ncbi:hypothetical protein [Bradyrhizobium guangxiense]|uniref:hypothetical protein n=1 Tax=Bradyrhizobium guangxiense TaxID=1325115 RepID=UPI001FE10C4D|nr:hypothetical protein [Bradyrhizobium guangxiense]
MTVLKILVSYPDGFAVMADLKRDMAILATSGRDWAERTKRLAARVPELDIFSQGMVERLNGGWRITEKGRSVLEFMEAKAYREERRALRPPWSRRLRIQRRPHLSPPGALAEASACSAVVRHASGLAQKLAELALVRLTRLTGKNRKLSQAP